MNRKIPFINLTTVTLTFVFLLTACGPKNATPTETTEAAPTQENAVSSTPQAEATPITVSKDIFLDPAKTEDLDSLLVSRYLYEGLVRLDENGNVQPGIAESWKVSDDQLDYIFEIRANAKFSDGTQITTDVIADNFNRWFDPQSPLHGDGNYPTWLKIFLAFNGERDAENRAVSPVDGVQKVDVNTFIVHLNRPVPDLLNDLAQPAFSILETSALTDSNYGKMGSNIISSGPYKISLWTDQGLTLTPNPSYWNLAENGDIKFVWK